MPVSLKNALVQQRKGPQPEASRQLVRGMLTHGGVLKEKHLVEAGVED